MKQNGGYHFFTSSTVEQASTSRADGLKFFIVFNIWYTTTSSHMIRPRYRRQLSNEPLYNSIVTTKFAPTF